MIYMLNTMIIVEFAEEMVELEEEGHDSVDVYSIIKDRVRTNHDTEIWEMVDGPDNILGFDFDDFLGDIMDDIEARAELLVAGS
jgi:hypothetical protein